MIQSSNNDRKNCWWNLFKPNCRSTRTLLILTNFSFVPVFVVLIWNILLFVLLILAMLSNDIADEDLLKVIKEDNYSKSNCFHKYLFQWKQWLSYSTIHVQLSSVSIYLFNGLFLLIVTCSLVNLGPSSYGFSKNVFSEKEVKPCFSWLLIL